MKYQLLAISCLMAAVRSRRHLCDDLTLPDCPAGTHGPSQKADYNPTGENRWRKNIENIEREKTLEKHLKKHWKTLKPHRREQVAKKHCWSRLKSFFRQPPCPDGATPICVDGSDPIVRNNICQREEKQCPQGQGKAVSESKSAHCQTYVKNHTLHLKKLKQLNYPGHCRAVGRLRGRFLSSVSQWKSRHLPFPHQEVCRQVKNIFYTRNCASHWKSTNLNKTEIAQKPFKV